MANPDEPGPADGREVREVLEALLRLSQGVGASIRRVGRAFHEGSASLAEEVVASTADLERMKAGFEESCIRSIASRRPAERDLRVLTTGMKIAHELTHIGELAARAALEVAGGTGDAVRNSVVDIPGMGEAVCRTLEAGLDAYLRERRGAPPGGETCGDELDACNEDLFRVFVSSVATDPGGFTCSLAAMRAARFLGRCGEHASEIGRLVERLSRQKLARED